MTLDPNIKEDIKVNITAADVESDWYFQAEEGDFVNKPSGREVTDWVVGDGIILHHHHDY